MANAARNAILRALIEGAITDLMVKTKVDNVYVDDSTTLAAKLSEIITSLNTKASTSALSSGLSNKADAEHTHSMNSIPNLTTELGNRPTLSAVRTEIASQVSVAISDLIDGAPGTYDTLKEIANYITEHADVVDTLNAAIGNKADAATVAALQAAVAALGSLAAKDAVSESDLDTALKTKLDNMESAAHSHSNKSVLDGITADQVSAWDGKGKFYAQASQPTNLTRNDLWAQLI